MDIATAALTLGAEVFKFINDKEAKKYLDESVKIQLELQKEYARGQKADDAKIEDLNKKAIIILEAARAALNIQQSS